VNRILLSRTSAGRFRTAFLCFVLIAAASGADENVSETLIGTPITPPDWSAETRARLEKDLEIARAVMAVAPEREDSWIWLGRRLGYLARNGEAAEVFTEGLERFPNSYKLLRFRGRHLARNREFDRAIADYRRAAELVEEIPDSYEPDGIINSRHQYLGSYRSNIHYYLGQTSWAVGDYEATLLGMRRAAAEPLVQHDDRRVATGFWTYLALRKLGRHAEAEIVVQAIPEGLELVENHDYYDGIRFFKGTLDEDVIVERGGLNSRFGVAMHYLIEGDTGIAEAMLTELVSGSSQGYWPAETELLQLMN
jgi:tetratricopeptide (TPR) repeat protein